MKDKYSAIWLSHSSIADFIRCPNLYYLRAIYKDPATGNKITRIEPPLALGQVVHDVIESLSVLPVEDRMRVSLAKKFDAEWNKISGKKGGFGSQREESEYKERGLAMIKRIMQNPGPLTAKAIKIKQDLPHYWFSEEENIILCGKIDWLEYLEDSDSVHIIDFKTGKHEEDSNSLQLPIYHLLVANTQKRTVSKASYWYLNTSTSPEEVALPDLETSKTKVMAIAERVKLARKLEHFKCPTNGCRWCTPLELIKAGKGEKVGTSNYNQDIYVLYTS